MTILNQSKVSDHISSWIKEYVVANNIKYLVLELIEDINAALTALLCKCANLPLICIHFSNGEWQSTKIKVFAADFGLPLYFFDINKLDNELMRQISIGKLPDQNVAKVSSRSEIIRELSAGTKSSILNFVASTYDGIVVGSINRSEGNLLRNYSKSYNGLIGINPIADLYKSEVDQLFISLGARLPTTSPIFFSPVEVAGIEVASLPPSALAIYNSSVPNSCFSYDEIEWADRLNEINQIIISESDPTKNPIFFTYTARQKEIICRLHQEEKKSRHKTNQIPFCPLRYKKDWIQ